MKTYDILRLLTDEEVERMLSARYYVVRVGDRVSVGLRTDYDGLSGCCPLGVALKGCAPSPTPYLIAHTMEWRGGYAYDQLIGPAVEFTDDADHGMIRPEDLAEIVRLSREG